MISRTKYAAGPILGAQASGQSERVQWRRSICLCSFVVALGVAQAAFGAPHLVTDIRTSPNSTTPLQESIVGGLEAEGVVYFNGVDERSGSELWRTDGTSKGTFRLTDLCPGACDSGATPAAFLGGHILFLADDADRHGELWRTAGVPGDATLVKEFCAGRCQSVVKDTLVWKGALWLLVQPPQQAPELWRSDGTPEGTEQVADFCVDLGLCGFDSSSSISLAGSTQADDALLIYVVTDKTSLVRTDGTRQGTAILHVAANLTASTFSRARGFVLDGPLLTPLTPALAPIFFLDGFDLWVSDGTVAGTRPVRDISDIVSSDNMVAFRAFQGVLYGISDDGDWFRSDGTAEGTIRLAHVASQFQPALCHLGSAVYAVTIAGIWRSEGTPDTTSLIIPLAVDDIEQIVEQPNQLFIQAYPFLFVSDGTLAGTHRIPISGRPAPDQYSIAPLLAGAGFTKAGHQLWQIDPSGLSSTLLHDFLPADGSSGPLGQIVLGDKLLFCAATSSGTQQMFASDGTASGTLLLTAAENARCQITPGAPPVYLGVAGGLGFFNAASRFWATDGTPSGTHEIGSSKLSFGLPIAAAGDQLIFAGLPPTFGECGPYDEQPWVSDGTAKHTREILALNPFFGDLGGSQCSDLPLSSNPGPGISLGSTVLFAADDLVHGRELFLTDGSAAGTHLVADINGGTKPNDESDGGPSRIGLGSNPTDFVRLGPGAVFVADDGVTGLQLWYSNGKTAGTHRVLDAAHINPTAVPHDLVAFQGAVFFIAPHRKGEALFRTDGTTAGTILVADLSLGGQPSFAHGLTASGPSLFFVAFNETTGSELWTSRGTPATTHLVVDLRPGFLGSAPQNLADAGGILVFAADDGVSGLEPWRSDGTAAGTLRLADLAAGEASSNPGPFSVVGNQLLFGADDGVHGRELWEIPLSDVMKARGSVTP
jgi:ELWxxDGT repeat protein